MTELEVLEHRVAQWFELPKRSVYFMDEARFAELVNQMEREVDEDAARRRAQTERRNA